MAAVKIYIKLSSMIAWLTLDYSILNKLHPHSARSSSVSNNNIQFYKKVITFISIHHT